MQRQNKSRITASNWQNTNSQKYHSAHDNCFTKHTFKSWSCGLNDKRFENSNFT